MSTKLCAGILGRVPVGYAVEVQGKKYTVQGRKEKLQVIGNSLLHWARAP